MTPDIKAIFLDVGNTLRIVVEDAEFQKAAKKELMALVGAQGSEEEFFKTVEARWNAYRKESKTTLKEASEKDLWTKWLLPDFPVEKITPITGKLTRLWRDRDGRRVPRSDAKETIVELSRRGYTLGIIANTITETEIPDWMESDGVTEYFKAVVLSSKVGYRKPMPEIYWEAASRVGIAPENCAYVGDNPIRDVEGTRKAGFGMMILFSEPATITKEPQSGFAKVEYTIYETKDLLDIFPMRSEE
ncbi:MAG: HAD family hydrolase [Anaerolineaceae bacterium]|nr:HAD family hydrolase [Anaerolineaceae bacterium]